MFRGLYLILHLYKMKDVSCHILFYLTKNKVHINSLSSNKQQNSKTNKNVLSKQKMIQQLLVDILFRTLKKVAIRPHFHGACNSARICLIKTICTSNAQLKSHAFMQKQLSHVLFKKRCS